jgi:hypothetical protein
LYLFYNILGIFLLFIGFLGIMAISFSLTSMDFFFPNLFIAYIIITISSIISGCLLIILFYKLLILHEFSRILGIIACTFQIIGSSIGLILITSEFASISLDYTLSNLYFFDLPSIVFLLMILVFRKHLIEV